MGMSASQMRYCMLTGKQSDVEFQGQQINQQRTTLATQSSALNTQLLDLTVPTPPSSDSYTKNSYSFALNGNNCAITTTKYVAADNATTGEKAGTYTINYSYTTTGDVATTKSATYLAAPGGTGYQTSAGTNLTKVDLTKETGNELNIDQNNLNLIFGKDYANSTYYKYSVDGTIRYVQESQLQQFAGKGTNIPYYYVDPNGTIDHTGKFINTSLNTNDSGRITSFTDANQVDHPMSVTSNNDEKAYNDAMNEYSYQKGQYEQQMNDINAKISVIQSEDKKLELKLRDLDTQQQAISTEIDSVKKVIDKNIESSFKIFA